MLARESRSGQPANPCGGQRGVRLVRQSGANSLITGATDEHASVLFEVMFRKNNDLRGNNRIEGQMWVPRVNGQTKCVGLSCLVSTDVWANPVINGFKRA